jgi:hypothetical protein
MPLAEELSLTKLIAATTPRSTPQYLLTDGEKKKLVRMLEKVRPNLR